MQQRVAWGTVLYTAVYVSCFSNVRIVQWTKGLLNGFAIGEQMKKVQVVSHNIVAVRIVLLGIAHNFPAALLMKNVCPPMAEGQKRS